MAALSKEQEILDLYASAIKDGVYVNTQWNKKIFYSDAFEINGRMNRGAAPFVIFPNGIEDDLENLTYEIDQGTFDINILLVISGNLYDGSSDLNRIKAFDWEVQKAIKTVTNNGIVQSPQISRGQTEVLSGFITRPITITSLLAICKDRSEY